jgi:hypothetical protein
MKSRYRVNTVFESQYHTPFIQTLLQLIVNPGQSNGHGATAAVDIGMSDPSKPTNS